MADAGAGLGGAVKGAGTGATIGSIGGPVGTVIGGAIGGIAGGLSGLFSGGGNDAQQAALQKYIAALQNQQVLNPQDYVANYQNVDTNQLHQLTPQLEQNIQQGQTGLNSIQLDPSYKQAQMAALAKLTQIGNQGLTIGDLAARNDINNSLGVQNRANQDAILQAQARRGTLGSGDELAARMAAAQNAYVNAAKQGQDLAVQRDARSLQGTTDAAALAGNLTNQDYGQQSNAAKAQDVINQFNTQNSIGTQRQNVQTQNTAQAGNNQLLNNAYQQNLAQQNKQADQLVAGKLGSTAATNQKNTAAAWAGVTGGQLADQASNNKKDAISGAVSSAGKIGGGLYDYFTKKPTDTGATTVAGGAADAADAGSKVSDALEWA